MKLIMIAAALLVAACSPKHDIREFAFRDVGMPNGATVKAESLSAPIEMARGAMFRKTLAKDRGLLYVYAQPGKFTFWMYQTEIPIDTIWMDRYGNVLEIVANMPPCLAKSTKDCARYGGAHEAANVLQLAGGMAEAYGVRLGSRLTF